jgi:hypothetical protein
MNGPPEMFYALVDDLQGSAEGVVVRLDAIRVRDFELLSSPDAVLSSRLTETNVFTFVLTLRRAEMITAFGRELREGNWLSLRGAARQGIPATRFLNVDPASGTDDLVEGVFLDGRMRIARQLRSTLGLDRIAAPASPATVRSLLGAVPKPQVIAVFNVGQGSAAALCDIQGVPLLYFDLGLAFNGNAHTVAGPRPTFCFTKSPVIVLSHWDTDHWLSAALATLPATTNLLAPLQSPIGLSHLRFAALMHQQGRLVLWPQSLPRAGFPGGEIALGGGKKRNDSGLILSASIARAGSGTSHVLLPGDCAYSKIPTFGAAYSGLVASHHGGAVGKPPSCVTPVHTVVYSYGNANTYGHPSAKSVGAHVSAGWYRRLDTVQGHVGLAPTPIQMERPCSQRCSLDFTQVGAV